EAMAAAQAERETALHKAEEALKQAAAAQRKRARISIALAVMSIFAVLAVLLGMLSYRQVQEAYVQREQAGQMLAGATRVIVRTYDQMDADTKKAMLAVFQAGAGLGDATSMRNLGILHEHGRGVEQNYVKARELFEKAADKGLAAAMADLGVLYSNGHGVARDYAKAREWYEKAAAKGDASATALLGNLPISEAAEAGRYAEALRLQEALAAKVEAVETKREGK